MEKIYQGLFKKIWQQVPTIFNLDAAVEGEKDVQHIDVHRQFEKLVVTLLVMRAFLNYLVHQKVAQTFVIQLQLLAACRT